MKRWADVRSVLLLLVLGFLPGQCAVGHAAVAVQSAPPAVLTGRVVADDTGSAVANARVAAESSSEFTTVVLSDADGRFVLPVSAGSITVAATKTGYGRATQSASGNQPLEIRLRRGAGISGRVIDEAGDPVVGARVVLEPLQPAGSTRPAAVSQTDDHGEYRLASLPAGSFVVALIRFTSDVVITATTTNVVTPMVEKIYYPQAPSAPAAEMFQLVPGDERESIDFTVRQERVTLPPAIAMRRAHASADRVDDGSAAGTAAVRGRVTSPDGRGIPRAVVRLAPQAGPAGPLDQWRVRTADDTGNFEFTRLAAGVLRVAASKPGYAIVTARDPARDAASMRQFELTGGELRERLDLTLTRNGALEGRVTDELGEPLELASVQLLQIRYENGRRRLVPAGGAARLTDDRGRYRLYDVPAGRYIVSAIAGAVFSADLPGYARSYFPGTSDPGAAQFVAVGPGQELSGVDVSMSRTTTVRVAGRLLSAAGEPTMATLTLVPGRLSTSVTSVPAGARMAPDGTFEFPNVAPGQYVIQASRGRSPSVEGEFAAMPVAVDGTDVTGLTVQLSAGSSVSGRIIFNSFNGNQPPPASALELSAVPAGDDSAPTIGASAEIHEDWTFQISGLNGAHRVSLTRVPTGWTLQAVRMNGRDVTDRAISFGRREQSLSDVEVVLVDRMNALSGTVADDKGSPVAGATVIVFSTDRARWFPSSRFLRKAPIDARGQFTIEGLPADSYYLIAPTRVPDDGEDAWQEPQFLDLLRVRAAVVVLGENDRVSRALRME
jgi:protocatechuate 3,4-dioxygenase beta subunit